MLFYLDDGLIFNCSFITSIFFLVPKEIRTIILEAVEAVIFSLVEKKTILILLRLIAYLTFLTIFVLANLRHKEKTLESLRIFHILALVLRNAYFQSYSHLKLQILVPCCEQNLRDFFPFVKNVKSTNDNFFHFLWFWLEKNISISAWFHMKYLKLHELGKNWNLYHRTKVKGESVNPIFILFIFLETRWKGHQYSKKTILELRPTYSK